MSKITVVLAILHQGFVRIELAVKPTQWATECADTIRLAIDADASSKPTSDNRNRVCSAFVASEEHPEVLLMVDADVIPLCNPLPLAVKMCAEGSPYDVIGLPTAAWQPQLYPNHPLRWMLWDLGPNNELFQDETKLNAPGLVEWDLVGSGAIMIHRRVLEDPRMRAPFADKFNEDGWRTRGHDMHFSYRCKASGHRVWASGDHRCGHCPRIELVDIARTMVPKDREPVYTAAVMPSWAAS